MKINRDQFLEQGYIILRAVVPQDELEGLRRSHEILVERQRAIWARERGPNDPPGGVWESGAQPRLSVGTMGPEHDEQTASAIEFWTHENMQGASSELLVEADVPVTEMLLMCNPVRDRGPAAWHRDFYPPLNAPLQAYADDILETGPRYVQWNLALHDDDVLYVVPGSHIRPNTDAENESIKQNPRIPLPGCVQTHLAAGDGVAYILPILHWGSNYSTKRRRTMHGGFARLTHYSDLSWLPYLSDSAQETFTRWHRRSEGYIEDAVTALRAVINKDGEAYRAALDKLYPGRGTHGVLKSTICFSKTAKHIYNQRCRDGASLTESERRGVAQIHPTTLQWGELLGARFSPEDAECLWHRFKPIDNAMKCEEEQFLPGFQGGPTHYCFNDIPSDLTVEGWIAGWTD